MQLASQESSADQIHNDRQSVHNLRLWHSPENTRVVFDVSADVKYSLFSLNDPLRLVVDIENADQSFNLPPLAEGNDHIAAVRSGRPKPQLLRFVFELKKPLATNSFLLSPNEIYGHRLVIDMQDEAAAEQALVIAEPAPMPGNISQAVVTDRKQQTAPLIVAIDAGHGGEDPGAIGYRGSREKKLTLSIAKRLKKIVDADPYMKSFMVRKGDYYVKLNKRRQLARRVNADIFVSIHADAFDRRSARGFSVFALSQRGATSAMARALAAKENASDLIGGVSLADKDEVLAKVLVDLSMTNTISDSVNLGGRILQELGRLGKLHSNRVEQAGFAVLKSPDIPSILVETGFITNPDEERKLRSDNYQQNIARAIYTAINEYRQRTPYRNNATYASPAVAETDRRGLAKAPTKQRPTYHKVVRGDTLSTIAARYGTSVKELRKINRLRSSVAVLGKRLKLPGSTEMSTAPVAAVPSVSSRQGTHVVQRGDSLSKIAERYGTSVKQLKNINRLRSDVVVVGKRLKLPGSANAVATSSSAGKRNSTATHVVRRGDSLSRISSRYNVTINAIKRENNLRHNTVYPGQKLTIPGATRGINRDPRYHKVRRGDTLSEIAQQYGATMKTIMQANKLRNRTVMLGQTLTIPYD